MLGAESKNVPSIVVCVCVCVLCISVFFSFSLLLFVVVIRHFLQQHQLLHYFYYWTTQCGPAGITNTITNTHHYIEDTGTEH
jgi:hypothetical protein